jgi:hypothetical protein
VGRDEIWGATAMVLAELLVVLGWQRSVDNARVHIMKDRNCWS